MRLFHKIFLCCVVIFSITFQTAGYLLINFMYENTIEQQKKYALQEYQYNKYILQSLMYLEKDMPEENQWADGNRTNIFTCNYAIYGEQGDCLFSNLRVGVPFDFRDVAKEDTVYQMYQQGQESYIFVYGALNQGGQDLFFVTETNISQALAGQRQMRSYFQQIFLALLLIVFPVIWLLSGFLTKNIGRVSSGAKRIAKGEYAERIPVTGRDETGELAENFNRMAERIEEKVRELSETARQQEDFTANFAHELKTPLTSVIGYADMLYQKELPRQQVKEAAEYILNEGMRLEALSLKLMDLFVLDKQDFYLEMMDVREIFQNFTPDIEMLCNKRGVRCHMDLSDGEIAVDFDLFKTLVMNVLDNSVKADCRDIWINGEAQEGKYRICIEDNGKGIPPDKKDRITESFYMVDKSRSRKQHGAGLGMALVSKIAKVHGAELEIESDGHSGTRVILHL